MKTGIAEYLKKAASGKTKADKQKMLRNAVEAAPQVMTILKYMFKDGIVFNLPEGAPPFRGAEKREDLQGQLYGDLRKIRNFMQGENPNMTALRREQLFVQLLESLDPDDAQLIIAMKDKKSPYSGLTKKLVLDTFPDQTVGW